MRRFHSYADRGPVLGAGRTDLGDETRAAFEALRQNGLEGKLRQKDLDPYRKHHTDEGGSTKAFLARLQKLRQRGAELSSMPAEVLADLDAAIGILHNAKKLHHPLFSRTWPVPARRALPAHREPRRTR